MDDARKRLLDAAEGLLKQQGYERLSVRAVNKAAGMNPAAVHYHFGSKQALVTTVVERRLGPVWQGRIPVLDQLAAAAEPPGLDFLVRWLVEPIARLDADADGPGRWLLPLLARLVLGGHWEPSRSPWSAPEQWTNLLARALPGVPTAQVAQRWRLARDLVLMTYGAPLADPDTRPTPPPIDTVIAFVAAGLGAPDHD